MSNSYTISGTIIEGKSSSNFVIGKYDSYNYESPIDTDGDCVFETDILVEGSISNFNHSFGHL